MTTGCDLSIIIVNWNGVDLLKDCIPSIYENTPSLNFETIVVDNGSDDQSALWCREHAPQVKFIELRENKGFSAANNEGLRLAQGRYVLLLNNDTIVKSKAINTLVNYLEEHESIAGCGPRLLNKDGSLQRSARHFPTLWSEFCQEFYLSAFFNRSHVFSKYYMGYWDHDETKKVDFVIGAAMLFRKDALEEVGPLDSKRFFMYYEETDLCLRLNKAGHEFHYVNDAEIIHFGGASTQKISENALYMNLNSRYNYFLKYNDFTVVPMLWMIHVTSGILFSVVCGFLAAFNIKRESAHFMYRRYSIHLKYHIHRFFGLHRRP